MMMQFIIDSVDGKEAKEHLTEFHSKLCDLCNEYEVKLQQGAWNSIHAIYEGKKGFAFGVIDDNFDEHTEEECALETKIQDLKDIQIKLIRNRIANEQ